MLVHKNPEMVIEKFLNGHLGIFAREFRFGIVCRHHKAAPNALHDLGFPTIFLRILLNDLLDVLRGVESRPVYDFDFPHHQ